MNVLVTGFAGTLGSEFTRHFLKEGHCVSGVDNNEWAVAAFPEHPNLSKTLGDFSDCLGEWELVVHCAAYKHVDLIESNQESAYENNVQKTGRLYSQTQGPVLFISTDKAVEPISHYGETKKMGELLTLKRGGAIARLGNILSSSGSVIPKWEAAIANLEPLPITDPDMTRYMIPAPEAVRKIMALYGLGLGELVVPSMGEPISVYDLAEETLRRHDYEGFSDYGPGNIVIGARLGEKRHEKLLWDDEIPVYTGENGVIVAKPR